MSNINYEARIHAHIDRLFGGAPANERVSEVKLEIYMNTVDRYRDLLSEGKGAEEAYQEAIGTIGNLDDLLASLGAEASRPINAKTPIKPPADKKMKKHMRRQLLQDHLSTILWMVTLTFYFIVSFITSAWHVTWILFLIAVAAQNLLRAILDATLGSKPDIPYWPTKDQKNLLSALDTALWMLILVAYFAVSFITTAWHVSWVIFLLGNALDSLVSIIMMYVFTRNSEQQGENA